MILLYFVFFIVNGLIALGLRALGVKYYWLIAIVSFLVMSIGFTVWLTWKIKNSPYP